MPTFLEVRKPVEGTNGTSNFVALFEELFNDVGTEIAYGAKLGMVSCIQTQAYVRGTYHLHPVNEQAKSVMIRVVERKEFSNAQ